MSFDWNIQPLIFKVIIDKCAFIIYFKPCFPVDSMFILCSFLFCCFLVKLFSVSLCLYPLLLVFVNVLFGFDLWLPCFPSVLTLSYICLLYPDSHIDSNIFLKKNESRFSYFPPQHFMTLKHLFVFPFAVPCVYCHFYNSFFFFPFISVYWLTEVISFQLWFLHSISSYYILFRGALSVFLLE